MGLLEGMQYYKGERNLTLYWDIETLAYNKKEGRKKPTHYKNVTYSVAIGWNNNGVIDVEVFPSFKAFYNAFLEYAKRKDTITKSRTTIQMIAHNCNKYDNHFLLREMLLTFDNFEIENLYMKHAEDKDGITSINKQQAKKQSKENNIVLEKRVKSSINLDLEFFLNGFHFNIIDNFMKTTTSIATLGKKLLDGGYLTSDQLKTDFNYTIFDREDDMTDLEAEQYALECFKSLDEDQMTYIHNDVIILGQCHVHYSDIFPGFDYSKMTFSVNIMNSYLVNELARFQLLNKWGKEEISYTNYRFFNMNLYNFIKGFYRGGMNMYNPKYVDTIINEPCFSIDINSSYPYVMYHEKIPTWLNSYDEFSEPTNIDINLDDRNQYTLYKMDKMLFNFTVLDRIESTIIKQMLVKYYNNDKDFVNINTNTLRMIQDITGIEFEQLPVWAYLTYDCEYFGGREVIFQNYYIKTQGKQKNIVNMESPYDYEITNEKNEKPYSQEEINLSKVVLNGLYGIPALRSHFNLFRRDEDGFLINEENGYKNTERNLLFSTFVTSQALYNLLEPLQYLTQQEIDDNFIYCDTDSLYMKSVVKDKIPNDLFDPISLGKWDVENEVIEKMYVLNHKKYAYLKPNGKIHVASAGIPLDAFNTDQPFDDFIKNDFHHGATVYNNKSIYNEQKTITIYPSKTFIEKGVNYDTMFTSELEEKRQMVLKKAYEEYDDVNNEDKMLYIESEIGSFSFNDVFPFEFDYEDRHTLSLLQSIHHELRY